MDTFAHHQKIEFLKVTGEVVASDASIEAVIYQEEAVAKCMIRTEPLTCA